MELGLSPHERVGRLKISVMSLLLGRTVARQKLSCLTFSV